MTGEDEHAPFVLETDDQTGMPPLVRIRHWVGATLSAVADDHLSAVMLVCTELVTNAYEHAGQPGQIRLWHSPTLCRVRVEVDDEVSEPPVPGASRLGDQRGRGMILVDKLADWGVHRRPPARSCGPRSPATSAASSAARADLSSPGDNPLADSPTRLTHDDRRGVRAGD